MPNVHGVEPSHPPARKTKVRTQRQPAGVARTGNGTTPPVLSVGERPVPFISQSARTGLLARRPHVERWAQTWPTSRLPLVQECYVRCLKERWFRD